jgi:hypothetical protein
MRRRDFIYRIAGSVVAWPLAARAQPQKLPTIGFQGSGTALTGSQWAAAFAQRLEVVPVV